MYKDSARKLLTVLFLTLLCGQVAAQDFDVSGIPGLVSEKVKEMKGAALLTLEGNTGAGMYLPIWTLQTKDGTPLIEFPTIGYRGVQGSRPDGFTTITFNLSGFSSLWFSSQWFKDHVKKSSFPPIFTGIAFIFPLEYNQARLIRWDEIERYTAFVVSVRLGGAK